MLVPPQDHIFDQIAGQRLFCGVRLPGHIEGPSDAGLQDMVLKIKLGNRDEMIRWLFIIITITIMRRMCIWPGAGRFHH